MQRNMKKYLIRFFLIGFLGNLFSSCASLEDKITEKAYEGNLPELKELLTKAGTVDPREERGWTPLMSASEGGQMKTIEFLLGKNAKLNLKNELGDTALMRATVVGNLEVVKLLVEKGASIHLKNKKGYTPLMKAAERNYLSIMQFLISKGGNVNEVRILGKDSSTALHLATQEGHRNAVELLIRSGANVNLKDSDGFVPIFHAIKSGNLEIVKLLVEAKADLSTSSYFGDTIHTVLEESGNSEIQDFFKAKRM